MDTTSSTLARRCVANAGVLDSVAILLVPLRRDPLLTLQLALDLVRNLNYFDNDDLNLKRTDRFKTAFQRRQSVPRHTFHHACLACFHVFTFLFFINVVVSSQQTLLLKFTRARQLGQSGINAFLQSVQLQTWYEQLYLVRVNVLTAHIYNDFDAPKRFRQNNFFFHFCISISIFKFLQPWRFLNASSNFSIFFWRLSYLFQILKFWKFNLICVDWIQQIASHR